MPLVRGTPLLRSHMIDLTLVNTTKTFNPNTGRFDKISVEETFKGVLTNLNRDSINYLGHSSYISQDRELHTTKFIKTNQIVKNGNVEYRVIDPKPGEVYYGNYKVYIAKRAGGVE